MAYTLNTMDGTDVRIIHATVRGWILAQLLNTPLPARQMMYELGLTERQVRVGVAEAQTAGLIQSVGTDKWSRVSMRPRA